MSASQVEVGSAQLHLVRPEAPTSVAILFYPTILGVDEYMRRFADEFAARGLIAAVWDPYHGEPISANPGVMFERSKELEDRTMLAELEEISGFLEDELGVNEMGGIGWCFGGRVGLVHAGSDPRVAALAAYNPTMYSMTPTEIPTIGEVSRADFGGQTLDEIALAASIRGPVQVSRPEHDFTLPVDYARLFDSLWRREYPTTYEYYPGATHGFSYTPGEANDKAHRLAWANTATLFATLGSATGA